MARLKIIQLQVCDRKFFTSWDTIERCPSLETLLNQQHNPSDVYFIDGDPEAFEHILRYIKRRIYPFLYDPVKGHNYQMYARIQAEAKHFGLKRLAEWLQEKQYLHAIELTHKATAFNNVHVTGRHDLKSNESMEFVPLWKGTIETEEEDVSKADYDHGVMDVLGIEKKTEFFPDVLFER